MQSQLPTEVELVYEVMPCIALRTSQEPVPNKHPCTYFRKWGTYHSFDYVASGVPGEKEIPVKVKYMGRATVVPEILSGCRKAPIMAIGINPNLPGWYKEKRGALNPLFDDYKQYAHYFRYRSTWKLIIDNDDYSRFGGGTADTPFSNIELNVPADASGNRVLTAKPDSQTMYKGYQGLLDSLAKAMKWRKNKLSLAEDFAYMNMVACPSARWRTTPDPTDPLLPPMTDQERDGIIHECFYLRKYFFKQLFQSLPKLLIVFSQATAAAFISEMQGNFSKGDPHPGENVEQLLKRHIRLSYGKLPDGTILDARVIFSPHISGDPANFKRLRELVLSQLVDEAKAGDLEYNKLTGHLKRSSGSCNFCPMLDIGTCDYKTELVPLELDAAISEKTSFSSTEKEKTTQALLLQEFENKKVQHKNTAAWQNQPAGEIK